MQSSLSNFVVGAGLVGYMLSIGLNARIARIIHASDGVHAERFCRPGHRETGASRPSRSVISLTRWLPNPLFWFFCFEAAKTCFLIPLFWERHMHAYQWALWATRPMESAFLVVIGLQLLGIGWKWLPAWAFVASQWFLLAQNQDWSAYALLDIDHGIRLAFAISMILLAIWRGNRWACGFAVAIVFEQASMLAGGYDGWPQMVPVFSWLAAQAVWLFACRPQPSAQSS